MLDQLIRRAAFAMTTRFQPSGRERDLRVLEYEFPADGRIGCW